MPALRSQREPMVSLLLVPQIGASPFLSSSTQNVNHSENNHPHRIHKMPVQGEHVDASGLLRANSASKREEQDNAQHDQPRDYVKGVQANQRVVRCSKKIRRDGQPVFVNQAVPFLASAVKKQGT